MIVLAVFRGGVTVAEAARREGVSQTSITNWRDQFLDGGQQGVAAGGPVGDELILVSHDPFGTESPYRSASPIFLHRTSCQPYVMEPVLPEQLTRRQLSVRSFDHEEMMIDAAVIDGTDLEFTIQRFFADTASDQIHVHNATRGVGRSP